MDKEERFLKEYFGAEQPFRVPDGYFDNLPDRIMESLPERRVRVVGMRRKLRYRYGIVGMAAASVCAVVFGLNLFLSKQDAQSHHLIGTQESYASSNSYNIIDQTADYSMLDNEDIYAYVSNN